MSSYINFYIKAGEKFVPIGNFSRSSAIYTAFRDVPYEKARPLTEEDLRETMQELREDLVKWETLTDDLYQRKKTISTFNNSVEEKIDALDDMQESINEARETIDELQHAISFTIVLSEMLREADAAQKYGDIEWIDSSHYLYCGIECGYHPDIID